MTIARNEPGLDKPYDFAEEDDAPEWEEVDEQQWEIASDVTVACPRCSRRLTVPTRVHADGNGGDEIVMFTVSAPEASHDCKAEVDD